MTENRNFILRDEGLNRLHRVSIRGDGLEDILWSVPVPPGRDLHFAGDGNLLIGIENGWELRDVGNGLTVETCEDFPGTLTAQILRSGNVLMSGIGWFDRPGLSLAESGRDGKILGLIEFPDFVYARLVRQTPRGSFLITANREVFEGSAEGKVLWRAKIEAGAQDPHAWKALRLPNGETAVTCGYAPELRFFDTAGSKLRSFTAPQTENPHFFSDFRMLAGGNFLIANWQGHGPGNGKKGGQLLELDRRGKLAWSWRPHSDEISSVQAVLPLDGIDISKAYDEVDTGVLGPYAAARS